MKERPILMSAPTVRAILAGTKTQTRRVVKEPSWALPGSLHLFNERPWADDPLRGDRDVACPYGQPGDQLYVRETWADEHPLAIQDGRYSQPGRAGIPGPPPVHYRTIYRADGEPRQIWRNADQSHPYFTASGPARQIDADYPTVCSNYTRDGKGIHWRPSIHMPRWASRILLEVTAVRVEQLQDISEADAIAEGIEHWDASGNNEWADYSDPAGLPLSARESYRTLWEQINGPGSWDTNPWVWVVEFKRVTP